MIIDRNSNKKNLGLIGRKEKLSIIKEQIKTENLLSSKLDKKLIKVCSAITKKEKFVKKYQVDSMNLSKDLLNVNDLLDGIEMQKSTLSESIAGSDAIISQNQKDVKSQTILKKSLKTEIQKDERDLGNYLKEVMKTSEELSKIQSSRDNLHQQLQDARINHLNLEGQRENIVFQESTAKDTIEEFVNRKSEIRREIKDVEESKKNLKRLISVAEKKLTDINGIVSKQESVLSLKQEAANDSYVIIEEMQAQIRSEQKNRESLLEELKNCELKVADLDQRISFVSERIFDSYSTKIPNEMIVDQTENELNASIERIEKSIENIGPINMVVQVEHEEENERLLMLTEQRDDLIKAEENLLDTIKEIDKIAREKFQKTFEDIGKNFEKLFTMFFEGGRGSLRLEGDPDPLEANIGIHAQPPGKRNQSLRQLSAGEKALTAIALLFSIYQVKPSPYCILDEVDAPLDDVNIRKFTRVLNNFSNDTQFIVVTHNKLTMESANFLYGVTMEKKGVSQLVSAKLD
jgi:chromosome segregation protein